MKSATVSLSTPSFFENFSLHSSGEQAVHSVPLVKRVPRSGPVLHPSPMADHQDVLSLNLTRGCAHRCAFCPARAYPTYPGDEVVYLFTDTVERLDAELSRRREKPRAVYVSPSTDPFPPLAEVQAETARVVEVLAAHGVTAWLMTRGYIRPSPLRVLAAHRERVKVTVGLTTLDRNLQRILEPLAAPPRLRLRQLAQLRDLGIAFQVALEPLVPTVTDTRENLASLLQALAQEDVRQVLAGYLFLRSGIRDNLICALEPHGLAEAVLEAFTGGPVLSAGRIDLARYLPKVRRQRGYAALMALAANLGITVRISGTTNPDFLTPRQSGKPIASRPLLFPHWSEPSVHVHSA
jgi:DNA repair photolyase